MRKPYPHTALRQAKCYNARTDPIVGPAARAVIFWHTGDPAYNASTPGYNSGWQYQGAFYGFQGVPIAPLYFITAKQFGGSIGGIFYFHNDPYTTVAVFDSPTTDLRIWKVDQDHFPDTMHV